MKYSQIKSIIEFCNNLHSGPCYRSVIEFLEDGETDFEVDNVRFIADSAILEVMADELKSDLHCLGCFNASFIADQCNWPTELVEAAQKGEAFEALGQAIADNCDMEAFAESYSSADGYGHHFNSYDFSEEELTVNSELFHVFDNH